MSKINKALDYNKLLESQAKGRLLRKILKFPLLAQIKYDGNYTVTEVRDGRISHYTSGGLTYRHTDDGADVFRHAIDGYYISERIGKAGKLGDRRYCNLTGPKADQKSTGHTYKIFNYLTIEEYERGYSDVTYYKSYLRLLKGEVRMDSIVTFRVIENKDQLDSYLLEVVKDGYEGLMLYQQDYKWKDTKSRTIGLCKLKKRRTADLLCTGFTKGEGKYTGMIGSLQLRDSAGRIVDVGSGLSDSQRFMNPLLFFSKVVEIEFEQIMDTYIQPTFIRVREDKTEKDID